jgi:type IV secretory pathway TrbD component
MPVHDDKRLATSKQPVRDGTKRCVTLFMGFLLYLLVVVVQDALTSQYGMAFHSYL